MLFEIAVMGSCFFAAVAYITSIQKEYISSPFNKKVNGNIPAHDDDDVCNNNTDDTMPGSDESKSSA